MTAPAKPDSTDDKPGVESPDQRPEPPTDSRGAGRKHNVQLPPDEQRASPDPKTGEGSHRRD